MDIGEVTMKSNRLNRILAIMLAASIGTMSYCYRDRGFMDAP